jgi:hypothetical protein
LLNRATRGAHVLVLIEHTNTHQRQLETLTL